MASPPPEGADTPHSAGFQGTSPIPDGGGGASDTPTLPTSPSAGRGSPGRRPRAHSTARSRSRSRTASDAYEDPAHTVSAAIAQMLSWGSVVAPRAARTVCRLVGMSLHERRPGATSGLRRPKLQSALPRSHARALRKLRVALRSLFASTVLRLMLKSQPVEPSGVELAQDLMSLLPDTMMSRFYVPLRFVHDTMGMRLFAAEIGRPASADFLVLRRVGNVYLVLCETGLPPALRRKAHGNEDGQRKARTSGLGASPVEKAGPGLTSPLASLGGAMATTLPGEPGSGIDTGASDASVGRRSRSASLGGVSLGGGSLASTGTEADPGDTYGYNVHPSLVSKVPRMK